VTCLAVSKELVFRDTKSAIVSTVTCACSWVSEKRASVVSLLAENTDQEDRRRRSSPAAVRGAKERVCQSEQIEGAADRSNR
jgi:hypothetical protein